MSHTTHISEIIESQDKCPIHLPIWVVSKMTVTEIDTIKTHRESVDACSTRPVEPCPCSIQASKVSGTIRD